MPSPLDLPCAKCPPCRLPGTRLVEQSRAVQCVIARTTVCVALALTAICISCGSVGSGPAAPVSVTVTPNSAQPFPGGGVQFSAAVQNASSTALNWQVNQVTGGNSVFGTINSSGYYTAPNAVPTPATVTVTAILQSDPSHSGSASVTIQSLSAIQSLTISPSLASVTTSQSLQLQVTGSGVTPGDVNWAVDGSAGGSTGAGTISQAGLYTPPAGAGAHTVTATLIANPGAIGSAQVEVTTFPGNLTWRNDNSRSGINNQELALSPASVSSSTFGKLFSCPVDGYVYAQPLYVPNLAIPAGGTHNVVFIATEKDSVFAFDADASPCQLLWQQTGLIAPGSQAVRSLNLPITNPVIVPFVGITGSPAIDVGKLLLYVVTATQVIDIPTEYTHTLYALDLATGQPKIETTGKLITTAAGSTPVFFPALENQRAALLLANGTVFIAFGSYGGQGDYNGWLFAYDASSLQQTGEFEVTAPPAIQGGIWQSGGGPSADASGDIFVITGNGPFNANRTLASQSYSDSFLRFTAAGGLSISDYFTPCDQQALESEGQVGIGSTAPLLLPDSAGSVSEPHLLIGGSEAGKLYVVNRDNMGEFLNSPCPDSPPRVQTIPIPGGGAILSTPLFWNNALYVSPANANLQSFAMSAGVLNATPSAAQSPESLGPQGSTPVLSSNGSANAILWLIDTGGALATPNTAAILRAYDPADLSKEIYNSAINMKDTAGLAVKFSVPTVANGKVYVGTQSELDVYGLLP